MIPRGLARRIDRLSRRAHAFHRFAHHPLCGRYAGEVIRVGKRVRLCRGCTYLACGGALGALAALGAALGVSAGGGAPPSSVAGAGALPLMAAAYDARRAALALAALLVLGVALAARSLARRAPDGRSHKLWTRALPSFLFVFASLALCVLGTPLALALCGVALALGAALFFAYRRRGPERSPCSTCPELHAPPPCSGFREIVRAERVFARRSGQLLRASAPLKPPARTA